MWIGLDLYGCVYLNYTVCRNHKAKRRGDGRAMSDEQVL